MNEMTDSKPANPNMREAWINAHCEVNTLRAQLARTEATANGYRAALQWMVDVNATDYEYRKVARAALKDTTP